MAVRTLTSVVAVCAAVAFCVSPVPFSEAPPPGEAGLGEPRPVELRADAQGPRAERTYAYGPHPRQQLAVHWQRRGAGAPAALRPGLVVLHGGYWRLDRAPGWREWSGALSTRGLVVFDVDYRRNVDARWPAQRADVLAALGWIAKRGRSFGADPDRLVLLGSSAGGHLATSVGTYGAGARRLAGVIGLSPVADPRRAWPRAPSAASLPAEPRRAGVRRNAVLLAGCPPRPAVRGPRSGSGPKERRQEARDAACAAVWRDMAAVSHASGADDAPMLLLHSVHDFVPRAQSRALARAERAAGMPARGITVLTVPGGTHGGGLLGEPGITATLLAWIDART